MDNKGIKEEVDFDIRENALRIRIKDVLKAKGTNYTALAGNGTPMQSKFQRQLNSAAVTFAVIELVLRTFPDISAKWLLLGEGDMIETEQAIIVNVPNNKNTGNQVIGDGTINDGKSDTDLIRELFEQNKKLQDYIIHNKL